MGAGDDERQRRSARHGAAGAGEGGGTEALLRGIVVRLHTGTGRHSGTDDMLYVGVSGTRGGREFPLDVPWFDDFERRSRVKYALGEVWDEDLLAGARTPRHARGDWNDPSLLAVDLDAVDRVYLRKHAGRRAADDDAWELDEAEVVLFGTPPRRRVYRSSGALWLGVAYGLTVWLPEVEPGAPSVSLRP
ncbi:MAG: hypothetical protein R3263_06675 [Myxococcota bacterium]|nr:hypothetical protein [Myxococcota bacterium]